MFRAFVVHSGQGENYQKHSVCKTRQEAQDHVNLMVEKYNENGFRIWEAKLESKRDLEDVIEDNLTDEQAQEWAS